MPVAIEVWAGSNGDVTKAYYVELEKRGPIGIIAVNLFRACKSSVRAKAYRGRRYKSLSYDKKHWSMDNLCKMLTKHAQELSIEWGWKRDPETAGFEWVLYVELPQGQASFHSGERLAGPDYIGDWDGTHLSADRIIAFCDEVMSLEAVTA